MARSGRAPAVLMFMDGIGLRARLEQCVSTGHGNVPWEPVFRMLNAIGYDGPISIEWEDAGMDRLVGGPDALAFIRKLTEIEPPAASFDAAFSSGS